MASNGGRRARRVASEAFVYPTCVRHAKSRKDTRLRHFFLCDACTARWTAEAFGNGAPLYTGERVTGYCQLCNKQTDQVRLRTWFLCDICYRVAGSIGRNHVAEAAILTFWDQQVRPVFPNLVIEQTDVSALLPRRNTDESATAPVDFMVRDAGTPVFSVENKTGRSAIEKMSQFQLDVSDCDTILNQVRTHDLPAYVIHAQVLEFWDRPPTVGYQSVGLWWTDIFTMEANFVDVQNRRDEMRGAAYFRRQAFQPIETFVSALRSATGWGLLEKFRARGCPTLYSRSSDPDRL